MASSLRGVWPVATLLLLVASVTVSAAGVGASHGADAPAGADPATTVARPHCATETRGEAGTWTRRPVPAFPVGPSTVVGHAVDPTTSRRQLLTNGHAILTTTDGCAWREAWRLPGAPSVRLPVSAETDRVLEVVTHPQAPERAWAVVAVGQDVAERTLVSNPLGPAPAEGRDPTLAVVLHSSDAGATWAPMESPPLPGTPGRLAVSPHQPDRLFLPTATGLQVSHDGGRTWQPLPAALTGPVEGRRPLDGVTSPVVASVLVDPADPQHLLGRTTTPVHSRDGGLTWSAYPTPAGAWTGPFPAAEGALFVRQEFTTSPVQEVWRGNETLDAVPTEVDGVPWRVARSDVADDTLMATWDRNNADSFGAVSLYRLHRDGRVTDVNDLGLPWVRGLVADNQGGFHLHTRHELFSLHPPVDAAEPAGEPQVEVGPFGETQPDPPRPASFRAPARIRVEPGDDVPLDLGLDLPRRPAPLDTYFLLDTSNSFEPNIQAVADAMADVVRSVRDAGIDGWFGIGELGTREVHRYRRLADVAEPGIDLQRGFERLRTGGHTESHLISLFQVATGAGLEGTHGPAVAPGQDPTWRRGAMRTVVVVTDVEFTDEDDPEARTRRAVYDALAARDVRVIGLEVVHEHGDETKNSLRPGVPGGYAAVEAADAAGTTAPTPTRRDLEELAAATGTFAPPGGVDCRDNGTVEIKEGDPLVCTTTTVHLARMHTIGGVLQRALLAQQDLRRLRVGVESAARLTPAGGWREEVDVRRDQRLPFTGTVGCSAEQAGQLLPVRLTADLARGARGAPPESLAATTVLVQCGDLAGSPVPPVASDAGGVDPSGAGPETAPVPPQAGAPIAPVPPVAPIPLGAGAPAASAAPGTAPGTSGATAPGTATGTSPGTAAGTAPGAATSTAAGPGGAAAAPDRHEDLELASIQLLASGLLAGAAAVVLRRRRERGPGRAAVRLVPLPPTRRTRP